MQHGANFNVFTSMLKSDAEKYTKRIETTYKDFKQYYEQEKSGVVGKAPIAPDFSLPHLHESRLLTYQLIIGLLHKESFMTVLICSYTC